MERVRFRGRPSPAIQRGMGAAPRGRWDWDATEAGGSKRLPPKTHAHPGAPRPRGIVEGMKWGAGRPRILQRRAIWAAGPGHTITREPRARRSSQAVAAGTAPQSGMAAGTSPSVNQKDAAGSTSLRSRRLSRPQRGPLSRRRGVPDPCWDDATYVISTRGRGLIHPSPPHNHNREMRPGGLLVAAGLSLFARPVSGFLLPAVARCVRACWWGSTWHDMLLERGTTGHA